MKSPGFIMNKVLLIIIPVLFCLPGIPSIRAEEAGGAPDIEILYIPRGDLPRTPGYSGEGVFLPVSEILELRDKATRRDGDTQLKNNAYITSLNLEGLISTRLELKGTLVFTAPSGGWSATPVDSGLVPWTFQEPTGDAAAFLARVDGTTYLYAKGPSKGSLSLKALAGFPMNNTRGSISLGTIFCPCRIELETDENIEIETPNLLSRKKGTLISLFPTPKKPVTINFNRKPSFQASSPYRLSLERNIAVWGAGIRVTDAIHLEGDFPEAHTFNLPLPQGLRLLRVESPQHIRIEESEESVFLTSLEDLSTLHLDVSCSAEIRNGQARIAPWEIPSVPVRAMLSLRGSDLYLPVPTEIPPLLVPMGGDKNMRRYQCWGSLPSLTVSLVRKDPLLPPEVHGSLEIARSKASVTWDVLVRDPRIQTLPFTTPDGWVLAGMEATKSGQPVRFALSRKDQTTWRVDGEYGRFPDHLRFTLHRSGSWGAPGTSTELPIPVVLFEGPRPSKYEINVSWPEGLNVRTAHLDGLSVKPGIIFLSQAREPGRQASTLLRALSSDPKGVLAIEGRDADIRATCVTTLSIGEDRTLVRVLLLYEVRTAPANSFPFILPKGTDKNVRIEGDGIRETIHKTTKRGEEWVIVTQNNILGPFQATLEWPLEIEPVTAPEIVIPNVTSRNGFIVLEGSETMRLRVTAKNLAETDYSELPPIPWKSEKRRLAVYRFVEPPYTLQVDTEKFQAEPLLEGLAKQAELTSFITPEGERYTQAIYTLLPLAGRQFFEVNLPENATLWSVLVDQKGVKPAKGKSATGGEILLIPLPSSGGRTRDVSIKLLYKETDDPLERSSRLRFSSPELSVPVNRTIWNLNLPPGFEYLSFKGGLLPTTAVREPVMRFLRTAYYPDRILFEDMTLGWIIFLGMIAGVIALAAVKGKRGRKKEKRAVRKKKPALKTGCTITLIELLIVMAVIAILAAIAVPNFLEAQVRSKVSRVKSDHRSMATAIESYYVDNNAYPVNAEILWQGPVKYMSSPFSDPYADVRGTTFRYKSGDEAVRIAREAGFLPEGYSMHPDSFWLVYSIGPDTTDNGGTLIYDPTNGTISPGDIIRIKNGVPTHIAKYKKMQRRELAEGEPLAKPTPKPPPAPKSMTAGRFADEVSPGKTIALYEYIPSDRDAVMLKRSEGLLSLDIEAPTGGVRRKFETIGRESHIEIRLLERNHYLRLRFVVWMACFLLMAYIWRFSRGHYKFAFLIGCAVTLFLPLVFQNSWIVFFNIAFQGILFSLVVPIINTAYQRFRSRLALPSSLLVILLFIPAFSTGAPSDTSSPTLESGALRIIVPYEGSEEILNKKDPSAFIAREDFTQLWNAAHGERPAPERTEPLLTGLHLDGQLSVEEKEIRGTLSIRAINPNNIPQKIPLGLLSLTLVPGKKEKTGAFLESTREGLFLNLPPEWRGNLASGFTFPCRLEGNAGNLSLEFPDRAIGTWRFTIPRENLSVKGGGKAGFVTEQKENKTIIRGAAPPGKLMISWNAAPGLQPSRGGGRWRVEIKTNATWSTLAVASWSAVLDLEGEGANESLPGEIRIPRDPSLLIFSSKGYDLEETIVGKEDILFRLGKTGKTEIRLEGLVPGPDKIDDPWQLAGVRVPPEIDARFSFHLEISDRIEILSIKTQNMNRLPTRRVRTGFSNQDYEASSPDWRAALKLMPLRPVFEANARELIFPSDGFLKRVVSLTLSPRESRMGEFSFRVPSDLNVHSLEGPGVQSWVETGGKVLVTFHPPLESTGSLLVKGASDQDRETGEMEIRPVRVENAAMVHQSVLFLVPPDFELRETDLAGAEPHAPTNEEKVLLQHLPENVDTSQHSLRSYTLPTPRPLKFRMEPIRATALSTVYNHVTVSDGLLTLEGVIKAEPRRGRIREIKTLLCLSRPDPRAGSRIQASGPVRNVHAEEIGDQSWLITVELTSPSSDPVTVRLEIDQSADTEDGKPLGIPVFLPAEGTGARALLLLRRAFEGELTLSESAGARRIDPAGFRRPELGFLPMPSDQTLELSLKEKRGPEFSITRHKREEALRAVVEILRQRTLITPDGMERSELEIVLQNQSEQFLKIALPYSKSRMSVYEVQVASRVVKTTFAREGDREILLVPLIRTGLLEPELTVRVVYSVKERKKLRGSGSREQKLPEILGGVPVTQSALVLMLPTTFQYSDFEGTLNRVELVDIEVDEALRQARQVERLSEAALHARGEKRKKALFSLKKFQSKIGSKVKYAEQTSAAYSRMAKKVAPVKDELRTTRDKLQVQRGASLKEAQKAQQQFEANFMQLSQMVQQEEVQQQMPQAPQQVQAPVQFVQEPEIEIPPTPPIEFPRLGDVFVFRQLQGTGHIRFNFKSRGTISRRKDFFFFAIGILVLAAIVYTARGLFSSTRRIWAAVFTLCLIAAIASVALDITIPVGILSAVFFLKKKKSNQNNGI